MHKIVFSGKILPGHDPVKVRDKLLSMLGLGPEHAEKLFSGKTLTIKKGLSPEEARRYLDHLAKRGIGVDIDPPLNNSISTPFPTLILEDEETAPAKTPAAEPANQVSTSAPALSSVTAAPPAKPIPPPPKANNTAVVSERPALKPPSRPTQIASPAPPPATTPITTAPSLGLERVAEEITCPKCGEKQPKRTLCRACATDMPRFAAARAQAAEEGRGARSGQVAGIPATGREAPSRFEAPEFSDEAPSWFSLSFEGRQGRLSYLWSCSFSWFVLIFGGYLALKTNSAIPGLFILFLTVVLSLFLSLRFVVLRNHDIGWSGWLSLLLFVPFVNGIYGLILLFARGTGGRNPYGPQPPRASGLAALAGIACFLFAVSLSDSIAKQSAQRHQTQQHLQESSLPQAPPYQTTQDNTAPVVIYTTSSCGVCMQAKAYMRDRKIDFDERDVENNRDNLREFYNLGGKGVPLIIVGDQKMSGFNPDRLENMLAQKKPQSD